VIGHIVGWLEVEPELDIQAGSIDIQLHAQQRGGVLMPFPHRVARLRKYRT
jgi:hypothetical protein